MTDTRSADSARDTPSVVNTASTFFPAVKDPPSLPNFASYDVKFGI